MMVPKFRAYIKNLDNLEIDLTEIPHKRHFVYGNLIKGEPNGDVDAIVGDLIEVPNEYIDPKWWCFIEKGSSEQFTGLKDANGTEIYEGDFLKVKMEDSWQTIPLLVKNVWDPHIWINESDPYYAVIEMVVIGNIHKCPEQLKVEK